MLDQYVAPAYKLDAFHCPGCGVYAHQAFVGAMRTLGGIGPFSGAMTEIEGYDVSFCSHCDNPAIWHHGMLVHPSYGGTPVPHPDMPAGVKLDYDEARVVADLSPRAAAALLRLALQKLCVHLGQPGERLDDDIGSLVRKGLNANIQQALDILRISGNNAVHPGELDLRDDRPMVSKLFQLLNTIVEAMITQPLEIKSLWDQMPEAARKASEKRDAKRKRPVEDD